MFVLFGFYIFFILKISDLIKGDNVLDFRPKQSLAEWSVGRRDAIMLVLIGLFLMWGFGWQTVGRRLWTNVDGVIITSRDVPAKGAPRYATEYTVRGNDSSETVFWAGPTDGSLARSMPVGTRILKKRWHLDYDRDGHHVGFPYVFYAFILSLALVLLVRGLLLLYTQRKLKTKGPT